MIREGREGERITPLILAVVLLMVAVGLWGSSLTARAMAFTAWIVEPLERPAAFLSSFFTAWQDWMVDRSDLVAQINLLKDRNNRLVSKVALASLMEAQKSAEESSEYLVDYRDPKAWWDEVRLDLRQNRNVQVGLPVLKDGALAGIVVDNWGHSANVRLISSPNSYVPVVIEPTLDLCVLTGDGKGGLWLSYAPPLALPPGTRVVTALGGDLLLPGIPVGELNGLKRENDTGLIEYGVTPLAQLTRLHRVSLLEVKP